MENHPTKPEITTASVIGSEDKWVSTAVGTLLKIMGTGDVYTTLSRSCLQAIAVRGIGRA